MPGRMIKNKDGSYKVVWGGETVAKSTTKEKAASQLRLLRGLEHGSIKPSEVGKKRRKGRR